MRISCTVKRGKSCGDRSAVWWVLWRGRDVRGMPFCKRVGTLRARPDGRWQFTRARPGWLPSSSGERKRDVVGLLEDIARDYYSDAIVE